MQSDSDYLQQIIAEDERLTTEQYMKLQQVVLGIMAEWKTIFDARVAKSMAASAEIHRQEQLPLEMINQAGIDQRTSFLNHLTTTEIRSFIRYGYTAGEVAAVLPALTEVFGEYREDIVAFSRELSEAESSRNLRDIHDPVPYAKLRERVTKNYCDAMDRKLTGFKQITKCQDKCFSTFIEITDKKFSASGSRDLDSKNRRRSEIRKLRLKNKIEFFESTVQAITQENQEFLDEARSFCPSCSLISQSLAPITEGCLPV